MDEKIPLLVISRIRIEAPLRAAFDPDDIRAFLDQLGDRGLLLHHISNELRLLVGKLKERCRPRRVANEHLPCIDPQ